MASGPTGASGADKKRKKRKGTYHKVMVYLGFRSGREDPDPDANRVKKRKEPRPEHRGPSKLDEHFGDNWTEAAIAKMIAAEVAAAMAKYAATPKPPPAPPMPAVYDADAPLKPNERRPKPHKWMESPDVKSPAGVRPPKKDFVVSEHATAKHVKPERTPLASRDYSAYPQGTGVWFGGPSFPEKKGAKASLMSASAAGNTMQFCVIVTAVSFSPLFLDLARTVMRKENVALSLTRWVITAAAVFGFGFVSFTVMRKPFARWLMRVASAVGVSRAGSLVAAAGIAFFTGLVGAALTQATTTSLKWLLAGKGWTTFVTSVALAAGSVLYHEWRTRRRAMLKRALTVFADVEKSPDGLAALMGEPGKKDTMNFAMGLTEAPGWARFREDEIADWLNTFLARVWPFYNRSICNLVRSAVEPLLEDHRPSMFRRIYFEKLDLGDQPIQLPKVRWLGTRSDGMGASIEVDLAWSGRAKIQLNARTSVSTIAIGVKDVEVYGKVQVTLQPLTPTLCPFYGLIVTLKEKPVLEFDLDLPLGLEGTVSTAIQDWLEELVANILNNTLVWPERLVIPIAADDLPVTMPDGAEVSHKWYVDNVLTLRNTGLICVKVKRAENVVGTDLLSKADSYVRLHVKGPNKSKTEVIMNDNDPTWNQSLYMLVDDVQERKLAIEVMDSDESGLSKDFRIASKEVPLPELGLVANEAKDAWFEFPETAERNGARPPLRANLEITYVPFDVDGAGTSAMSKRLRGVGMLTVRLIRAKGLKAADSNGTSDPFCKVSMPKAAISESDAGNEREERIRYKSKVISKTLEPEWNETYEFVGVREDATLAVECYDRDKGYVTNSKKTLGSFDVVVARDVLAGGKSGMVVTETEKEFELRGDASVKGTVTLHLSWQPFAA